MEHKENLARIDTDINDMCITMKDGMGEVFGKVKDILEVKTKKHVLDMNRLTQTQQAEVISMKSEWEMERQGLLEKLRKVEEELVMVKDENKLKMMIVWKSC